MSENRAPAIVPEFEVSDLDASRRIYTEVFGFKVDYERPEDRFVYLVKGNAHLMLEELTGPGRRFTHAPLERPFGRGINFQIEINDVDDVYKRVEDSDLIIHIPIEERWYRKDEVELGNRQFCVFDPDGYLLRFFTDIGDRPA